jgi:hypothetical protein
VAIASLHKCGWPGEIWLSRAIVGRGWLEEPSTPPPSAHTSSQKRQLGSDELLLRLRLVEATGRDDAGMSRSQVRRPQGLGNFGDDDTATTILHVDMDAFYASVELLNNVGLPLNPTGNVKRSQGVLFTLLAQCCRSSSQKESRCGSHTLSLF